MAFYVIGAGGLGREVLDTALAAGQPVAGFADDGRAGQSVRDLPVLAPAALRSRRTRSWSPIADAAGPDAPRRRAHRAGARAR